MYKEVTYPLFGLKKYPKSVRKENTKVYINAYGKEKLLDDRLLGQTYTERAFNMYKLDKVKWKFIHCHNLDAIIFNQVKFGIDETGKLHDFRGERAKIHRKRVKRIKGNEVYLEGVRYPILLPFETNLRIRDAYAKVQFIEGRWRIREFFTYSLTGEEV